MQRPASVRSNHTGFYSAAVAFISKSVKYQGRAAAFETDLRLYPRSPMERANCSHEKVKNTYHFSDRKYSWATADERDGTMRIFNLPEISAIYYALLQCGYPYYALDRDASLVEAIERFQLPPDSFDTSFFSEARQNSCEAYKYWPRAALLEDAAFLINRSSTHQLDFDIYRDLVMGASNLTESDRNHLFWKWVAAFPSALNCVLNSENFKTYFRWESKWIKQQNSAFSNNLIQLQKILDKCIKYYPTSVQKVSLFSESNQMRLLCGLSYKGRLSLLLFRRLPRERCTAWISACPCSSMYPWQ